MTRVRDCLTIDDTAQIHRECHVHGDVTIGARTQVWQYASILRGAKLGDDCSVGACAVVDGAVVGDYCRIGAGAQLHPGTLIGDQVFVGPGAIFCNDRWPRADFASFPMDELISGALITVHVCDGASIGAGAIVLPGVEIGERAMVAAGAVATEDIPSLHLLKRTGAIVRIDERITEVVRRVK